MTYFLFASLHCPIDPLAAERGSHCRVALDLRRPCNDCDRDQLSLGRRQAMRHALGRGQLTLGEQASNSPDNAPKSIKTSGYAICLFLTAVLTALEIQLFLRNCVLCFTTILTNCTPTLHHTHATYTTKWPLPTHTYGFKQAV